jgi:polysaccharide chain length determinant protein (PEP-CTERM system associated)
VHELADQILSQLRATWRYRWYAAAIAWIVASGGWFAVFQMPNRYEAYGRVYVDTQSVLRPLMSGLAVQPDLNQMVAMMSRTLISRPNLEKVIRMADLNAGLETNEERARLINHLISEVAFQSAGKENLYTISFEDENPEVAKRVVEALLQLFVEGSLSDKRKDSDSARRFIDEQLETYRAKLVASEEAITAFKRRHLGLMPGEGGGYFARIVDARTALREAELALREAENSRDAIRRQIASLPNEPSLAEGGDPALEPRPESEIDARIRALEQKLDNLRLSYTEQHPDIVAIVPMIAQLKERRDAEAKLWREQKEAEAKLRGGRPGIATPADPVNQQLAVSLAKADADVAAMRTRVAEFGRRYAELQAAANALPQIEAEFTQLTRDYEVNKARYDELLNRRASAQMSGDLESSDAAMGFRVIDPPRLPVTPKSPNRPRLMTMVLLAALGAGVGVAFLMTQIKPTFNDERRLSEATGLQVLGTVVMAWTDAQKAGRVRDVVGLTLSFVSLLSAYAAIMAMLMLTVSRV